MDNRHKYPEGFWESNKKEIINMYLNQKKSAREIGRKYDCYGSTIITHLTDWGIYIRNNKNTERVNSVYKVDAHYFDEIDNLEKAYWLGYIVADGHVSKGDALMMACSPKDVDILEKFKMSINSNHPILEKTGGYSNIAIGSKHLCNKLNYYGISHNKTYDLDVYEILKFIPKLFYRDFIRGLFDGDGSIQFYNYAYAKGFQYHFGVTGLKKTCEFVSDFLHINTKLIHEGNGIYTCRTANARLVKYIFNVLYDGASVYCNRKFSMFSKVVNMIHSENKDTVRGVCRYLNTGKWIASCHKDKKNITIGYYETRYEAEKARLKYEYEVYGQQAPQRYLFDEYGIGGD